MNGTNKKTEDIWNERVTKLFKVKGDNGKEISNREIARRMNIKYKRGLDRDISQKNITRWMSVGYQEKGKLIGFPKYENMLLIADYLGVDVGYLTGETDAETFDLEEAANYLHLSPDAVKKLRKSTSYASAFSMMYMHHTEAQYILNKLFCSEAFFHFVRTLYDVDKVYTKPKIIDNLWKSLDQKYSDEVITAALELIGEHFDDSIELPSEEVLEAIKEVNAIIDRDYDDQLTKEELTDSSKYRLQLAFNELVEELYPSK